MRGKRVELEACILMFSSCICLFNLGGIMRKLAIGILTYNRDELLCDTLESLFQYHSPEDLEIVLIDNGSDERFQLSNKKYAEKMGLKYRYNETVLSTDMNTNIEWGHRILIDELLKCDAELFCILEDDWKCTGEIPVDEIWEVLTNHEEVGQVRIRDYKYDDTFYGGSSRHFITKNKIVFDEVIIIGKKKFKIADMHWVNCCNVMKKNALKQMNAEFSSEYEKMQLFYKLYPRNVQFEPGIFYHIGPQRIREDFRAKGLFLDEGIS